MLRKTIAKISGFVICLTIGGTPFFGCSTASSTQTEATAVPEYQKPKNVGRLQNRDLIESSGIAASYCQKGVYWTHNDSGDGPFIFAIDSTGKDLGRWRVVGAQNTDWEDIATSRSAEGKCFLYLGEIGDNKQVHPESGIYRIAEPTVINEAVKDSAADTQPADLLRFRYPDGPHNAETLLEHPQTGMLYVVTKRFDGPASIFRLRPDFNSKDLATAEKLGEISVPSIPNGLLTGGAVSPDGRRIILCDYTSGYELTLPNGDNNFDDIWKQKPVVVELGDRKQGEGVTYSADGNSILATSEGKGAVVYEIDRRPGK